MSSFSKTSTDAVAAPQSTAAIDAPGVDRCMCFDVRIRRILDIIERTGGGLLEAHRQTGCGARCGLCLPYIQVAIKTGHTTLPVMWADEFRKHGVNPGRIEHIQRSMLKRRG